jgi:hypothetical protein
MILDNLTVQRQYMREDEYESSFIAAEKYIAGCPDCGRDAEWRDVLLNICGPHSGTRTIVQNYINCGHCDIQEFEV